jgi:hypothetical protein
MIHHLPTAK